MFIDKHLADNWQDAKYIYDTARELKFPLMAGSSLPAAWRYPPADVRARCEAQPDRGPVVSHARRLRIPRARNGAVPGRAAAEGETGIASVTCLTGDAVWKAVDDKVDPMLFRQALERAPWV